MTDEPTVEQSTREQQAELLGGRFAQLLHEVLTNHAPNQARVNEQAHYQHLEAWLEDLEQHTSKAITPFLQSLLDKTDMPPEFEPIIREAIETPAQFSAIVTQLFLYGIVSQILGSAVAPFLQVLSDQLWTSAVHDGVSVPVAPAVIATAAARGLSLGDKPTVNMPDWAYSEAAKSGVGKANIDLQASIVGTPPAPQELFELFRRGIIGLDDIKRGLAEGDTRDDWIDQLVQLRVGWLTPTDFVRAAVQGQITYADARDWAKKTGLDVDTALPIDASKVGGSDDMFGLAWAESGRPPGPVELADMTLRGIIDKDGTGAAATTFQQGIAESDIKTKWTEALWKRAQYVPPPAEIGSLLERGAITKDQAVALWRQRGVPQELAEGYAFIAEQQHISQDKLLAKGEVLTAYYDRLVDHEEAIDLLDQLGYRDQTAAMMLDIQDFKRTMQAMNAVVRRVGSLYGAHKLSATDAKNAMTTAGVPASQADRILEQWQILHDAPIRLPTVRAIGRAVKYGTLTQDDALAELAALGYQPRDAVIELSSELGAAITPLPPAGSTVTG